MRILTTHLFRDYKKVDMLFSLQNLLRDENRIVISDFGAAKLLREPQNETYI